MKSKIALTFIFALLGVYSVSSSLAYPVSKSANSSSSFSDAPSEDSRPEENAPKPRPQTRRSNYVPPSSPMAPGSHNISLGLGQVFLMGDLSDSYENNLGIQVHYNYGVSDLFAFDSDFGYSSHSNGDLSIWHMVAGLRSNLVYFDQLVPFFNIDLGFYHPSETFKSGSTQLSASGLLFGMQLGAGVDLFMTNRVFFGTSLTLHDMFESTKTASDGSTQKQVGGSFLSFLIHAGVAF